MNDNQKKNEAIFIEIEKMLQEVNFNADAPEEARDALVFIGTAIDATAEPTGKEATRAILNGSRAAICHTLETLANSSSKFKSIILSVAAVLMVDVDSILASIMQQRVLSYIRQLPPDNPDEPCDCPNCRAERAAKKQEFLKNPKYN